MKNYKAGRIREIKRMGRWLLDKKRFYSKNRHKSSHHIN